MPDTQTISTLRARDMMTVEDLFICDGYVLRFSQGQTAFSDRTFAQFFREELSINIDDPKWSEEGTSKGKRLRYFLRTVDPALVVKTSQSPVGASRDISQTPANTGSSGGCAWPTCRSARAFGRYPPRTDCYASEHGRLPTCEVRRDLTRAFVTYGNGPARARIPVREVLEEAV